mgnify:CR=1 FL=1
MTDLEIATALAEIAELRQRANNREIEVVTRALVQCAGYVDRAAVALGWHRRRLQHWLEKHPAQAANAGRLRASGGWTGGAPPRRKVG